MTRRFRGGLEILRDTRLGLGFWFVIEVKRRLGETSDPELLHTDALLALYFLGAYRLPRERDEFGADTSAPPDRRDPFSLRTSGPRT